MFNAIILLEKYPLGRLFLTRNNHVTGDGHIRSISLKQTDCPKH